VTAGIAPKPVVENALVRVFAYGTADELTVTADVRDASYDITAKVGDVGLAPGEQIRSGLAEEVLHAVGDEPCRDERKGKTEQACVQLPQLALPDERLGDTLGHGCAGHEDDGDDDDEDDGDDDAAYHQEPCWHRLVYGIWKSVPDVRGGGLAMLGAVSAYEILGSSR
jgi:hypothetical protein